MPAGRVTVSAEKGKGFKWNEAADRPHQGLADGDWSAILLHRFCPGDYLSESPAVSRFLQYVIEDEYDDPKSIASTGKKGIQVDGMKGSSKNKKGDVDKDRIQKEGQKTLTGGRQL